MQETTTHPAPIQTVLIPCRLFPESSFFQKRIISLDSQRVMLLKMLKQAQRNQKQAKKKKSKTEKQTTVLKYVTIGNLSLNCLTNCISDFFFIWEIKIKHYLFLATQYQLLPSVVFIFSSFNSIKGEKINNPKSGWSPFRPARSSCHSPWEATPTWTLGRFFPKSNRISCLGSESHELCERSLFTGGSKAM